MDTSILLINRMYPFRGYILGVQMHTTAWDWHWGVDEVLKRNLMYLDRLRLT